MRAGGKLYYVAVFLALLSPAVHVYLLLGENVEMSVLTSSTALNVFLLWLIVTSYQESKKIYNLDRVRSSTFFNPFLKKASIVFLAQHHEIVEGIAHAKKFLTTNSERLGKDATVKSTIVALTKLVEAGREKAEVDKWHAEGLAQLSEILRNDQGSMEELASTALNFCVSYSNSKQGILFILNEESGELVVYASYARSSTTVLNVKSGEGIIGQTFINAEPLFVERVPPSFYKIESALGSATPTSAAILPLIAGNDIIGILELAAFEGYSAHVRDWLAKSCEAVAATIRSKLSNERIKRVLHESEEKTIALTTREKDLERVKLEQAQEIQRLNLRHEENLKLVEQKVKEVELAKADVENIRTLERDRQKKQTETQSKIMQATLEKFKVRENQLLDAIHDKEETIRLLTEQLDPLKINIKP